MKLHGLHTIKASLESLVDRACHLPLWRHPAHPTVRSPGREGITTRRAILLGMFGGIAAATVVSGHSFAALIKGHAAAVNPTIQKIGVSAGYNGTIGSGWGGSFLPRPTASAARAFADPVRPSMREMFENLASAAGDTTLGVLADFVGKVGGAQGLQKVRIECEGVGLDIPTRTSFTYASPADQTFNTLVTNFLYHFTIDSTVQGTREVFLRAKANDTGADELILGPYLSTVNHSLVAAPWGGPAIYDKIVTVDVNSPIAGDNYHAYDPAIQATYAGGFRCPLVILPNNGAYPQTTNGINLASKATQLFTFAADPRTVTTGVWLGDGTASAGIVLQYDGPRWLGSLTKVDICQLGVGWSQVSTGWGTNDQTMSFQGCEILQTTFPGTPTFATGNGVSGSGALYNGTYSSTKWINDHVRNFYFFECNIHDCVYGMPGGVDRNCTGSKVFKWQQTFVQASYNSTINNAGLYNNPNAVAMAAYSIWYGGAGTLATEQTTGGNTGAITGYKIVVDGSTIGTPLTVTVNTTFTDLVAYINSLTNFHATLLATTPQTSRSANSVWFGVPGPSVPGNEYGNAIIVPLAIPHSSGSARTTYCIFDAHSDLIVPQTVAPSQNIIVEGFSAYGKKGATVFEIFSPGGMDIIVSSVETSDDASTLGVNYGSFATLCGCECSNVVLRDWTMQGVGDSYQFINGFVADDAYCGLYNLFIEQVVFGGATVPGPMALVGVASRTASIVTGGDANCLALGAGTANSAIWQNALGTAPYGVGGGVKPNLTPIMSNPLLEPSGRTAGSRNPDGTRKVA